MFNTTASTPEIPAALGGPLERARAARERFKAHALQLRDQGYTLQQIQHTCGIGSETLLLWRREENEVRPFIPKGNSRLDAYAAEIEAAHRGGEPLRVIAERYCTTIAKISTYAKKRGWPPRGPRGPKGPRVRHALDDQLESIRELYESGISAEEIARRFEVTAATILGRARRLGWQRPPSERAEQEDLIFQYLQQGLSIHGVERNTGLSRGTIAETMRRYGWQTLAGASDERAGAVPRYEEAVRPPGIRPRLAPRRAPPEDLSPAVRRDRTELKNMALLLQQLGLRVSEVCAVCGITAETLRIFCAEAGRQRQTAPAGHTWTEDHEDQLREAWFSDDDLSVRALARRLRLTRWHLNDMARRRGWPQRSGGKKRDSPPRSFGLSQNPEEVRALWDAGERTAVIAERFRVTQGAVSAFARRHHFPRRLTKRERLEELMFQCIMDGMPINAIARQLELHRSFITRLIKSMGWKRPGRWPSPRT